MIHNREFILVNKNGDRWDFQQFDDYYGFNPVGLGITKSNSYIRVKDDYLLTEQIFTLKQISLDLVFLTANAYDKFREFINFIAVNQAEDFKFIYIPAYNLETERKEYFAFVQISDIGKTEISQADVLSAPIIFDRLSNWQLPAGEFNTISTDVGKAYPYAYPYVYRTSASGTANLSNTGHRPVPLNFEFLGPTNNPKLSLLDSDDNVISVSEILIVINANEKIILISDPKDQKIIKINTVTLEETNIYELQNFDYNTFINLPIGDYKLVYDTPESNAGDVLITFNEQFIGI